MGKSTKQRSRKHIKRTATVKDSSQVATQAMALAQQGQLNSARQLCEEALQTDPANADVWHVLGMTMHLAGEAQLAVQAFEQSVDLETPDAALLCNLGVAYAALGQHENAVENYQQALAQQCDLPEAHNNLGNTLQSLGRLGEAADHYRKAIALNPQFADAWTNFGSISERFGDLDAAQSSYHQALEIDPRNVSALNNLGSVLSRQEHNLEAIECLKLALELKPDSAAAFSNLAFVFAKQGNHSDVLDLLYTATTLDPAYASNYLFMLSKDPSVTPAQVFQEHRQWGQALEESVNAFVHEKSADPNRRLRIGYVSPDFRQHVVAKYIRPVLQQHDCKAVETFCYAEVFAPDSVTQELQGLADHWRITCGRTSEEVAAMVRRDKIDILVDLAGHTARNRLDVFAYQPAPVQAAWIGYPNTTGLARINYRITSEYECSAGEDECYTEQLVRLPGVSSVLVPPNDAPEVSSLPALKNGYVTFGSLHRLDKITGETFDRWSRILSAVPSSRLLVFWPTLYGARKQWMEEQLNQRGIGPEQIDLRHEADADGYLSVYNEIDIALDPTPWTGSTTTTEALWMGVAAIALFGERRSSRGSAVVLHQLGMDDMIVDSEEKYIELAVRMAGDLPKLEKRRASLRETMQERLETAESFTRGLEETYRDMWRTWCST